MRCTAGAGGGPSGCRLPSVAQSFVSAVVLLPRVRVSAPVGSRRATTSRSRVSPTARTSRTAPTSPASPKSIRRKSARACRTDSRAEASAARVIRPTLRAASATGRSTTSRITCPTGVSTVRYTQRTGSTKIQRKRAPRNRPTAREMCPAIRQACPSASHTSRPTTARTLPRGARTQRHRATTGRTSRMRAIQYRATPMPVVALWRWVLAPLGRVLAVVGREVWDALGHAWRIAGHVSLAVGRFLGTLFRWIFVEPVRWVYRTVLTPVGHVIRDVVLRPVAEAARSVGRITRAALASARESVRQARADFRRMLFGDVSAVGDVGAARDVGAVGETREREAVALREPTGADTRTLGSSTTALTKD